MKQFQGKEFPFAMFDYQLFQPKPSKQPRNTQGLSIRTIDSTPGGNPRCPSLKKAWWRTSHESSMVNYLIVVNYGE
jgi:hypothetical protein